MTEDTRDPVSLFHDWFEKAKGSEGSLPEAMSVASVDADGRPSTRMVLLKHADEHGFVFYTNLTSRKGAEITANSYVALLFHWKSLKRQIRIEGPAVPVSDAEADALLAAAMRASREAEAAAGAKIDAERAHAAAAKAAKPFLPVPHMPASVVGCLNKTGVGGSRRE